RLGQCCTTRPQWAIHIRRTTHHTPRLAVAVWVEVDGAVPPLGMCGRPAHRHRTTRPSRARRPLVARRSEASEGWGVPNRQALVARRSVPAGDGSPVSALDAQAHLAVAG